MMHRMLCIQSCGKPAHTGAFAPNHVLMFVQNPAFGYCAPPCVDEEKGLSRVKVFRMPCWLLVRRTFKSAPKFFYSRLCILEWGSGAGCFEVVAEWVLGRVLEGFRTGFRSRFWSGFWNRFRSGFPERVPMHFRSGFRSGFPARSDQNHCAKPCKMHGHQRLGHTVSYALCSLSTSFVMVIS